MYPTTNMSLEVTQKSGKSFDPVPAGNHVARIYSIVHIGHILEDTQWGAKNNNKVRITWELPNETKVFKEEEGARPLSVSRTFNISWHEKAGLRKFVRGLEGKDQETFDLEALLGKVCMLNVSHNQVGDRTYANIDSAAPLPKGMSEPEAVNEQFILNYTDKWDEARFEKLPDFLKEQMKQSDEYKRKQFEGAEKASPLDDADSIPF
jgi:hypothetical protein